MMSNDLRNDGDAVPTAALPGQPKRRSRPRGIGGHEGLLRDMHRGHVPATFELFRSMADHVEAMALWCRPERTHGAVDFAVEAFRAVASGRTPDSVFGVIQEGTLRAVRDLCGAAAKQVREDVVACDLFLDDLTPLIVVGLENIADGETPNNAFGIPARAQGRPIKNEFLNFVVWKEIRRRMEEEKISVGKACRMAAADPDRVDGVPVWATLSAKRLERIYLEWNKRPALPRQVRPVPSSTGRKTFVVVASEGGCESREDIPYPTFQGRKGKQDEPESGSKTPQK